MDPYKTLILERNDAIRAHIKTTERLGAANARLNVAIKALEDIRELHDVMSMEILATAALQALRKTDP